MQRRLRPRWSCGNNAELVFDELKYSSDVTKGRNPPLQETTTMSEKREINQLDISNKDLPKASKDQKDPTRKVEHPPLANVKFDTFVYILALLALLAAIYYTFQTLSLS